jgi:hypothetical protein
MTYTIPSYTVRPGTAYQPGKMLILDIVPGILEYWSTRPLRKQDVYKLAIRGRDATTNEQDFSSGQYVGGGALALANGGNLFIPDLYGRVSGLGASQSTAGAQPLGVSSGSLITKSATPVLHFDGSADFLEIADDPLLNLSTQLSVCCWVKSDVGTLAGNVTFIGKYDFGDSQREWYFGYRPTGEPILVIGGAGGGTPSTKYAATPIAVDSWQFLGATYNAGVSKIYINGVEVATLDAGTPLATLNNFATPATIGCNLDSGTPANFLDGKINDIMLFNTVLTEADFAKIYKATL